MPTTIANAITAAVLVGACTIAAATDAIAYRTLVPVVIDGQAVRLEMSVHKPDGVGPFPTLVFNHGSTGYGTDSSRFRRSVDNPALAAVFVSQGWVVVFPARRGRAGSDGEYDEGFSIPRVLGYSCIPSLSLSGAERALKDIEAAWAAIAALPFVDRTRMVIGGQSRGGGLSVAFAGTHPALVGGVINFVGGWLGSPCPTAASVNRKLMALGAAYPKEMLWLYATGDHYYDLDQSRALHQAFVSAGGKAKFAFYELGSTYGHDLYRHIDMWSPAVDVYIRAMLLQIDINR